MLNRAFLTIVLQKLKAFKKVMRECSQAINSILLVKKSFLIYPKLVQKPFNYLVDKHPFKFFLNKFINRRFVGEFLFVQELVRPPTAHKSHPLPFLNLLTFLYFLKKFLNFKKFGYQGSSLMQLQYLNSTRRIPPGLERSSSQPSSEKG